MRHICKWCAERESNPHTFRRRFLRPTRIPVPASAHMVHGEGLEPSCPFGHQFLRLACLPIPPAVHIGAQSETRTRMPGWAPAPQTGVSAIPPSAHMAERERLERSKAFLPRLLSREVSYQLEYRSKYPTGQNIRQIDFMVGQDGLEPSVSRGAGFTVRCGTNYALLTHIGGDSRI